MSPSMGKGGGPNPTMTPEAIDVDDGEGTSDRPTISQQYAFSVGEDGETDGAIEPSEESVETDLEAFGASVDHRERDTRIDQPEASSFGVDDRATVTRSDGGEQRALFADTDDDQQTLTGERAASQCLFESDDTGSDDRTSERAASANTDDETPRALADGGRVEDGESAEKTVRERSAMNHPAVEWDYEQVSESGINITHFHVAEAERRQGIGSAAMDALLDRFASEGYEYAVANIHGGEIARRFLEKHGMTIVEGPNADGFVTGERNLGGRVEDGESDESEPQSDDSSNEGHAVKPENSHEESEDSPRDNDNNDSVNPHRHVPDEIDYITADGIEQVHDHLNDENAAIYAASSVEEQAAFLWKMVDQGVIDLSLRGR